MVLPEADDGGRKNSMGELDSRDLSKYYDYRVQYSQDDEVFIGSVVEWPSLRALGESQQEALEEIKETVAFAIEDCREENDDYPESFNLMEFSGRFSIRIEPSLHRELTREAKDESVSLNQLITRKLSTN